jgi:hypothetical protein
MYYTFLPCAVLMLVVVVLYMRHIFIGFSWAILMASIMVILLYVVVWGSFWCYTDVPWVIQNLTYAKCSITNKIKLSRCGKFCTVCRNTKYIGARMNITKMSPSVSLNSIRIKVQNVNDIWRIPSSGMWRRVGILLTDVSEERIASIFRVEAIHDEPAWADSFRLSDRRYTQLYKNRKGRGATWETSWEERGRV